jgi:hypothetical protein
VPIVPDTKDWTWVVERPCPDCGFDATEVRDDEIGRLIRDNASVWPSVLARPDVRERPRDDVWSPLEYACHVRDVYRIYDARLVLMLTEVDPQYANWDQDKTAIDEKYFAQNPDVIGRELVEAASVLATRFDGVTGDEWGRRGTRSDGAEFIVSTFARYLVHDPVHHLWDVGACSHE